MAAVANQARVFEIGQMPGNSRLGKFQNRDQVANAQFAFEKKTHNPEAGFIRECFKNLYSLFHTNNISGRTLLMKPLGRHVSILPDCLVSGIPFTPIRLVRGFPGNH